jgi:integrase
MAIRKTSKSIITLTDKKDRRRPAELLPSDLPGPADGKPYIDHPIAGPAGFHMRVFASGTRKWVLLYRHEGQSKRAMLGEWQPDGSRDGGHMSVAAACAAAENFDRKADPVGAAKAEKADRLKRKEELRTAEEREAARPTVGSLIELYKRDVLEKKRPATREQYEHVLNTLIPAAMKELPLRHAEAGRRAIQREDIVALHRSMADRPYMANRALAVVSAMFGFGAGVRGDDGQFWCDTNPADGVERYHEEKRERFLSDMEMGALLHVLDRYHHKNSLWLIRLLLATGARRGEWLGARWSQIDMDRAVWSKPSSHTKQRKQHVVPLNDEAIGLLQEILAERVSEAMKERRARLGRDLEDVERHAVRVGVMGGPVFPGERGTDTVTTINKHWAEIKRRATVQLWATDQTSPAFLLLRQIERDTGKRPSFEELTSLADERGIELGNGLLDLRIHDLRHSYASMLINEGLSLSTVGGLLGHTQAATTSRYAHLALDTLRSASQLASNRIRKAASSSNDDNS